MGKLRFTTMAAAFLNNRKKRYSASMLITRPPLPLNILNTKIGGLGIISTVVRLYLLYDTRIIFDIGHSRLGGSKITLGGYINDD